MICDCMYALYYCNMEMAVDMCLFHGYILTKKTSKTELLDSGIQTREGSKTHRNPKLAIREKVTV